ncbi:protein kinase C [Culex quinquefasciatus]|uniref:Protein kinase C n=1 Tax=Culex quinquefasciatus TaxID=7176 RepID=B0VZV8_CULQU|nr:protein kinase C [Culex quinquefasciatus]|eukprot:XP_001841992.1 protein kinase C [Culex quinquefasciatus]
MSSSGTPQSPPEITAEWTVHAQLTLSHQGSSSNCDKPATNPEDPAAAKNDANESDLSSRPSGPAPVKVVYKFSTADSAADGSCCNNSPNAKGKVVGGAIFGESAVDGVAAAAAQPNLPPSDPLTSDKPPPKPTSSEDSGLSNNSSSASASERPQTLTITPHLFPKCTSTCSIVLTADLHPASVPGGEVPTIVGKCASTSKVDKFTLFPEQPTRIYEAKDASCQTSDIEAALDKLVRASGDDLRKKVAEVAPAEKYNSLTRKSPLSAAADIISPSNTLQSQRSSQRDGAGGAGAGRKKPRTVHIDVYCTGSDAESSSSSDAESSARSVSSSSSSGSRFDTSHFVELKSAAAAAAVANSASHPTVYESEECKVRHKRAGKHEVPRRLLQQTVDQSTLSTIGSLKKAGGQGRKRCTTNEEINESKQILFSRILGQAPKEMTPFPDVEYLPRDPSDDNLSSNYPFSNRSTKRDITGSSLSSALASGGADEVGDLDEATGGIVNLHRSGTTATHSDSFEYENSEDRYRIYEMESRWGNQSWKSPSVERRLLEIHNPPIRRRNSESDNLSESDHSFVYDSPSRPGPSEPSNHSQAEFSDSSPSTVKSCPSRSASNAKRILQQALLKAGGAPPVSTRVWSPIEGYSTEYLALARRFGSLITGKRKPGVHMGPVRNPECQCEHCRRWVVEREGGLRERALSVDDSPYNIVDMRRKYHLRNYNHSSLAPLAVVEDAQTRLSESSRKLDLLRKALELRRLELPQDSQAAIQLKAELQNVQASSPVPVQYTSLHPFRGTTQGKPAHSLSFSRCAAVTGKLEVRLMGCQDLLEDVPGRSRRDKDSGSSPGDLKSFVKGVTSRSSSKSYSVKDETSSEIMAVIKLDNITVGQTSWRPCSQQAWDQRFSIDLDRSRELEIGIYWRDWRSLCAVKFLRLEEFIDDIRHGMALQLEPQGLLFAEIKFLNPMISRKPKLQRQRMIFNKQQVKNIPRAKQMNINVATWGRLLKRNTGSSAAAGTAQPMITTPSTPSSTAAPFDTVVEHDPAETLGESADFNTIGLGGGRPLGIHGVAVLPDSPSTHSLQSPTSPLTATTTAGMRPGSTPASFRQKKPPMPSPPPPSQQAATTPLTQSVTSPTAAAKMDQEYLFGNWAENVAQLPNAAR